MKTLQRKRILGFTLIELMIVVGIVAILLAIAYPSYAQYVRKAKRGDAQQLLMNWSINQEIWRSNNTRYNDIEDDTDPSYIIPDHENYNFVVADVSGATYTLQADAENDQENDKARDGTPCDPLEMNQNGVKSPPSCWE